MGRRELSIEQVQRWVISFLIIAVSLFPLGAMVAAVSTLSEQGRRGDAIVVLIVMGALGIIAAGVLRMVHTKRVPSLWLIAGVVPAALTAFFVR